MLNYVNVCYKTDETEKERRIFLSGDTERETAWQIRNANSKVRLERENNTSLAFKS